jgi:hypothetical protein
MREELFLFWSFVFWSFEFVSNFGFRASDLFVVRHLRFDATLAFIFINVRIDPDIGFIAELDNFIVPAFFFFHGDLAAVRF